MGREQVTISEGRTLYADNITKSEDGSFEASGRVYVDGGERPSDQLIGWPRYAYAGHARWRPATQTLELRGLPILEYRRGRVVSTSAESEIYVIGERISSKGPTESLIQMNSDAKQQPGRTSSCTPQSGELECSAKEESPSPWSIH